MQDMCKQREDFSEVLLVAMEAGEILLENGAEINRVEETILRISGYFGVEDRDVFVLSNGIFTTGGARNASHLESFARVQHIPMQAASLDKVVAVNQLSRDVEAGAYSLEELRQKLAEIRCMPGKKHVFQILASGIGAGCFSLLLGGDLMDGLAAAIAGFVLYLFILKLSSPKLHLKKITENLCGSVLMTICCILFYELGFGHHLNYMIIGAIIPLVPGVPFTNGIRDIADCNYIAGMVRLLDALLVFVCIAIGVGAVFLLYQQFMGGVMG